MRVSRTPRTTAVAPPEWISGAAWIDEIAPPEGTSRFRIDSVHFAPGARTAWHRHPFGQVLHVTEGAGLVQCRGGEVTVIRAGDTVRIAPDEWHWHGASPTTFMTHLAVQDVAPDGTEAERGPQVSETEYRAAPHTP
ncbi:MULTISPECIES: cupin domain-containing protein [unclassified Streptomyces]|uniref:(R)-mandelonitrile lyase n=1 Tax=unclassified Streptomyces TaxID=2593676 RepID=UPI0016603C40|nr:MULTISPECIES: cupin domain-containing protein [unclassified Streptomyces]MBD0707973.1 cupin [Streptomyces sp. CBMA291]MBD0715933.1 cupin [Streptomyces sp. CBMA370]